MDNKNFVFGKENFLVLGIAIAVIVTGFILMSGGGSTDGVSFNPEIFSTRRIVVAPLITLSGFALVIVSILRRRKSQDAAQ